MHEPVSQRLIERAAEEIRMPQLPCCSMKQSVLRGSWLGVAITTDYKLSHRQCRDLSLTCSLYAAPAACAREVGERQPVPAQAELMCCACLS
jgi:hypothetical protein